jgi:beta-phosphoglucomutase-like phosphatase (HAD superfamily)
MLGLPDAIRGCLFDLDGVLTKTAKVHDAAWTEMFDDFLRERSRRTGEPFVPFDPVEDYDEYVDGKPRADGTRSFLAARGIELPEGREDDPPGAETVHGLGNRKNQILLAKIRSEGVEVYDGSVRYVRAVRDAGLRRAVVSSSANCRDVLAAAHIEDLFEARIASAGYVPRGRPRAGAGACGCRCLRGRSGRGRGGPSWQLRLCHRRRPRGPGGGAP